MTAVMEKPSFDETYVKATLESLYDLQAESIREMPGFYDQNFKVNVAKTGGNLETLVFKITNAADSTATERSDFIPKVLSFLISKGFPVPEPIKNVSGLYWTLTDQKHSPQRLFMLTYLRGQTMDIIPCQKEEHFNALLAETARMVASFNSELQATDYKLWDASENDWSLENCTKEFMSSWILTVDDAELRSLCNKSFELFKTHVLSAASLLRKGIIHDDINAQNVIVELRTKREATNEGRSVSHDFEQHERSPYVVSGIIDWAEVKPSFLVFELATMLAMLMCETRTRGFSIDNAARSIIRGYSSKLCPTQSEKQCVFYCVVSRLAVLICLTYFMRTSINADGVHEKYIMRFLVSASSVLRSLHTIGNNETLHRWFDL